MFIVCIRSVQSLRAQRPSAIVIGRRHGRQRVDAELRRQSGSMSWRHIVCVPLRPQHPVRAIHSNRVLRRSMDPVREHQR